MLGVPVAWTLQKVYDAIYTKLLQADLTYETIQNYIVVSMLMFQKQNEN